MVKVSLAVLAVSACSSESDHPCSEPATFTFTHAEEPVPGIELLCDDEVIATSNDAGNADFRFQPSGVTFPCEAPVCARYSGRDPSGRFNDIPLDISHRTAELTEACAAHPLGCQAGTTCWPLALPRIAEAMTCLPSGSGQPGDSCAMTEGSPTCASALCARPSFEGKPLQPAQCLPYCNGMECATGSHCEVLGPNHFPLCLPEGSSGIVADGNFL